MLIERLYAQRSNMLIGALCGVLMAWGAAIQTHEPMLTISAAVLTTIAILRVAMAYLLPRLPTFGKAALELLFEVGAFAYSAMCGLIAAQCVLFDAPASVQTLTVANAIGYGVAMASRNAGRPAIANGQLVLATGPVIVACALTPDLAYRILAITTALLLPAMISISSSLFQVMRTSIAAAETSARLAEKMQLLARTDIVTGLSNRAGLNHHLVERLMKLESNAQFALFWLDLDRFKEVNDTLGHPVGDRVLSEIATRLREHSPAAATIARFGGDEFIIACETSGRAELEQMATKLLQEITRPILIEGDRLEIRSSMGIAMMPDDGNDLDSLMQGADLALYHSKVNGRNQFSFFNPAMTRDLVRRREIETELRQAILKEELSIFFQPIVDLATGRIRSFEALVRWFHPEKGELRPDEFIPVAEETGVIITLGNWITAHAAKTAAQWPEDVTLCVNLSPLQIRAPGAALGILNAIQEAAIRR
jgi:diguanylate cyclase (GGDEF)-like protein